MNREFTLPRLVVAGTASGVGKTTTMVALIGALKKRGLRVACFKCGPDYLDPTYYRLANGGEPHNLDPWMMGREGVMATLQENANGADIALIEGMMGLYDGLAPNRETGSTAQLAKWLSAPVLLVVDASAMARSLAALALGYVQFDPEVAVGGLWCNGIGSEGHLDLLRRTRPCRPVLGGLPKCDEDAFSERHLGLVAAQRDSLPQATLESWAGAAEQFGDLDRILDLANQAPKLKTVANKVKSGQTEPVISLGIARDEAFSFYYAENLRLLETHGARLVPFSPMEDKQLPAVDGLYLGGGYPELHAAALSANERMRQAMLDFATEGGTIYAECGGFMYLTQAIRTSDGQEYPMVGWFPGQVVMSDRLQAIGYAEAVTCETTFLGSKGTRMRGHQFRYSHFESADPPGTPLLRLQGNNGRDMGNEGWCRGNVCGSYFHVHWASNSMVPRALIRHLVQRGKQA